MLLQGDGQLNQDADKRNTSLQLGVVKFPEMKMRGVPCKQFVGANVNR
jgi:hypothetical protein